MDILDGSETTQSSDGSLTSVMKGYLTETAKWGKFLAITSFVFIGLMVIGSFSLGATMSQQRSLGAFGPVAGTVIPVIYFLGGLLLFFPTLYLLRFSTGTLRAIPAMDISATEKALGNLKSMFKFHGIMMIITLGVYILFIVVTIAKAVASV